MTHEQIIKKTSEFVKSKLENECSGHDYSHIERVFNISIHLAKEEGADLFIVGLASLLHDIGDWKFTKDNLTDTSESEDFLKSIGVDYSTINIVSNIIKSISFKGGVVQSTQQTIEGQVVQDADRLDALGAIGIARTFTYGGYKNRLLYDPNIKPKNFKTLESVKNEENTTINHFYEKLLKLKDLINTKSGKKLAIERHEFMENFLKEFYREWNFK